MTVSIYTFCSTPIPRREDVRKFEAVLGRIRERRAEDNEPERPLFEDGRIWFMAAEPGGLPVMICGFVRAESRYAAAEIIQEFFAEAVLPYDRQPVIAAIEDWDASYRRLGTEPPDAS